MIVFIVEPHCSQILNLLICLHTKTFFVILQISVAFLHLITEMYRTGRNLLAEVVRLYNAKLYLLFQLSRYMQVIPLMLHSLHFCAFW
jgi:hypothetical protein